MSSLIVMSLYILAGASCGGGGAATSTAAPASSSVARTPTAATLQAPVASIDPKMGPAGTTVVVAGTGWAPGSSVVVTADGAPDSAKPYATVDASATGAFSARFILEKTPSGAALSVGRFDLVAKSGTTRVVIQYQVQTPRPIPPTREGG